MKSIKFPKMLSSSGMNVFKANEYNASSMQNVKLLLRSERGELICDPYFGLPLKKFLFEQNGYILKDILIDTIYTQIAIFLPQIKVERKDIEVVQDKERLWCTFRGINQIDYQPTSMSLVMFTESENK